jgi:hypothetical protein
VAGKSGDYGFTGGRNAKWENTKHVADKPFDIEEL